MSTRWQKIMKDTGCDEETARTASRALSYLGEIKGTALTMPPEVMKYIGDRLCLEAAEIFER